IRGETTVLERDLKTKEEQLSKEKRQIATLQGDLSAIEGEFAATKQLSQVQDIIEGRLLAAQQELTEEMKRLQERTGHSYRRPIDAPVGGIPVDSEYIIFVVDTSGSMFQYSWTLVVRKMAEVLEVYPQVKGIQVMNDMGQYMFSGYRGQWIPDTPQLRAQILDRLQNWAPFSNSSPVEGINAAIQTFYRPGRKISIYTLGDDFSGRSIRRVVKAVEALNRSHEGAGQLVRIHAIGFPVHFPPGQTPASSAIRFAALMRELSYNNGGTFIGLTDLR
ncbi:MAG: VWA domain-containing protein, partial [Xanthomonadales bacterium]|nr:VWA domain-containing protein [Xanthomonadales bacterium]